MFIIFYKIWLNYANINKYINNLQNISYVQFYQFYCLTLYLRLANNPFNYTTFNYLIDLFNVHLIYHATFCLNNRRVLFKVMTQPTMPILCIKSEVFIRVQISDYFTSVCVCVFWWYLSLTYIYSKKGFSGGLISMNYL
jgi:hypothetical protein